jgi:dienelactone hydrolase
MRVTGTLIIAVAAATTAAAAPLDVEIPAGAESLHAVMYRPEAAGPFPAIVALHGCDGLIGRGEAIAKHYGEWGERLTAAGFVVVFPDSYGSRGTGPQCDIRSRVVHTTRERVKDAHAARRWLQHQSFVQHDRVSVLGWANGATAALWAIRRSAAPLREDDRDFRSAAVLYPGCRRLAGTAWSSRVPTLLLLGSADDWMPATFCEQMVAGARGRSAGATVVVYPGAHHDFDHPGLPFGQLAFTSDGSGRAHVGTDPRARSDALERVPTWLAR